MVGIRMPPVPGQQRSHRRQKPHRPRGSQWSASGCPLCQANRGRNTINDRVAHRVVCGWPLDVPLCLTNRGSIAVSGRIVQRAVCGRLLEVLGGAGEALLAEVLGLTAVQSRHVSVCFLHRNSYPFVASSSLFFL